MVLRVCFSKMLPGDSSATGQWPHMHRKGWCSTRTAQWNHLAASQTLMRGPSPRDSSVFGLVEANVLPRWRSTDLQGSPCHNMGVWVCLVIVSCGQVSSGL